MKRAVDCFSKYIILIKLIYKRKILGKDFLSKLVVLFLENKKLKLIFINYKRNYYFFIIFISLSWYGFQCNDILKQNSHNAIKTEKKFDCNNSSSVRNGSTRVACAHTTMTTSQGSSNMYFCFYINFYFRCLWCDVFYKNTNWTFWNCSERGNARPFALDHCS